MLPILALLVGKFGQYLFPNLCKVLNPGGYNLAFAFASLPIDQLSLVEGWGGSVVGGGGARPPPT